MTANINLSARPDGRLDVLYESMNSEGESITLRLVRPLNPALTLRELQRDVLEHAQRLLADMLANN